MWLNHRMSGVPFVRVLWVEMSCPWHWRECTRLVPLSVKHRAIAGCNNINRHKILQMPNFEVGFPLVVQKSNRWGLEDQRGLSNATNSCTSAEHELLM